MLIHFYSDVAYNLTGFNITFTIGKLLLKCYLNTYTYLCTLEIDSYFCVFLRKKVVHPSLDIVNEPVRPLLFTISSRSLYQGKVFL